MSKKYLNGLFLSQALWKNHHAMLQYYNINFAHKFKHTDSGNVIDVPCGHGMYSYWFKSVNPDWYLTACDLSQSSIEFVKKFKSYDASAMPNHLTRLNIFQLSPTLGYDAIVCGELLEHLEEPEKLLKHLQGLLAEDGKLFLTTAIYAAAIDHIYLFHSAQEVRDMLEKYFVIEDELVLPVYYDAKPEDIDTPINYACILRHKE